MRTKQGHPFRTQVGLELAMQLRVPFNPQFQAPKSCVTGIYPTWRILILTQIELKLSDLIDANLFMCVSHCSVLNSSFLYWGKRKFTLLVFCGSRVQCLGSWRHDQPTETKMKKRESIQERMLPNFSGVGVRGIQGNFYKVLFSEHFSTQPVVSIHLCHVPLEKTVLLRGGLDGKRKDTAHPISTQRQSLSPDRGTSALNKKSLRNEFIKKSHLQ